MLKHVFDIKDLFSNFFTSDIGLKQGDPSSPLIFILFVNDLIFLILFADDQVLFAKSTETIQSILNDVENYCNLWGLKINVSKTKAMIFEKGRHAQYVIYIYNTAIEVVQSFKNIGITLFKTVIGTEQKNV
jgi:hypothetical protein